MRVVISVVFEILINKRFTYFWYTYSFNRGGKVGFSGYFWCTYSFNRGGEVGFGGIGVVGSKSNDIEFFQFAVLFAVSVSLSVHLLYKFFDLLCRTCVSLKVSLHKSFEVVKFVYFR